MFFTIRAIYNIWFHPLSKYPGPWYAATTNLVYYIADITGYRERWILRQHQKYGEVVRTGPIRLSYTSASAWKDIVGHRSAGKLEMLKDPWLYDAGQAFGADGVSMISNVDSETHGKMRKIFTNAFSDRALREQEPLLLKYVDKLIRRIHTDLSGDPNRPLDLVLLLNCTTFDIMADLTFGESLGMLDNGKYTPWVARIFDTIRYAAIFGIAGRWVWLRNLVRATLPASMRKSLEEHRGYVNERVERRMAKDTDQPDIWNLVLRNPENVKLLGRGSMNEHANLFMVAGTETTATLLSGLTYFLLKKPSTYEKIVAEVRSLPEDGLHIDSLRQLPYLQACFEEALRMYPPVPMGMPRVVPPGGAAISGGFVPEGVSNPFCDKKTPFAPMSSNTRRDTPRQADRNTSIRHVLPSTNSHATGTRKTSKMPSSSSPSGGCPSTPTNTAATARRRYSLSPTARATAWARTWPTTRCA